MSSFRFELNREGVGELLKSEEMQEILSDLAAQKAAQAGLGYGSDCRVLSTRAVATVYPTDKESAKDAYDNNTLVQVISG